jgi:hypothetical protein
MASASWIMVHEKHCQDSTYFSAKNWSLKLREMPITVHGNVLFPCNRLFISEEMYSYFGERCTLQSIVWRIFVTTDTTRFVTRSFFCGFHHQKCHSPVLACPTCVWNLSAQEASCSIGRWAGCHDDGIKGLMQ